MAALHQRRPSPPNLPFMRRREKGSFSSEDRVELKGAHVGLTPRLLTLSLLGREAHSYTLRDSRRASLLLFCTDSPWVVALNRDRGRAGADDDRVASRNRLVI